MQENYSRGNISRVYNPINKKTVKLKAMNDGRSISVASISQDSFYRDLNPEQMILAKKSEYNFDHPDTIDDDEIFRNLDFRLR